MEIKAVIAAAGEPADHRHILRNHAVVRRADDVLHVVGREGLGDIGDNESRPEIPHQRPFRESTFGKLC